MPAFKRIMVGLDFSATDETLIEYTAFLSYYIQPEKIYFVNVQDDLTVPANLKEEFPDIEHPEDERLETGMHASVEKYFPDFKSYDVDFELIEGSPRKEMLRWTLIKNIDLLILGKKDAQNGSGIIPQQLARKVSCSILFIPEMATYSLRQILVPTDFSEHAVRALETALLFSGVDKDIVLITLNIYQVPYGYYKTGKSEKEFAMIMRSFAKQYYQEMMEKVDLSDNVEPIAHYVYDHARRSTGNLIYKTAVDMKVDILIVGPRGKNSATALFLGSVTEKLIKVNDQFPILIVKEKDQAFSFIDMIESI